MQHYNERSFCRIETRRSYEIMNVLVYDILLQKGIHDCQSHDGNLSNDNAFTQFFHRQPLQEIFNEAAFKF